MSTNDVAQASVLADLDTALRAAVSRETTPEQWALLLAKVICRHPDPEALLQALVRQLAAFKAATLLAEKSLAEDWNDPEEDAAWSYLQPKK